MTRKESAKFLNLPENATKLQLAEAIVAHPDKILEDDGKTLTLLGQAIEAFIEEGFGEI